MEPETRAPYGREYRVRNLMAELAALRETKLGLHDSKVLVEQSVLLECLGAHTADEARDAMRAVLGDDFPARLRDAVECDLNFARDDALQGASLTDRRAKLARWRSGTDQPVSVRTVSRDATRGLAELAERIADRQARRPDDVGDATSRHTARFRDLKRLLDERAVPPDNDPWLAWLISGRFEHMDPSIIDQHEEELLRIRARVLRGARIEPGQRVLDVGAGLGFMAEAARHHCGAKGRVISLDASWSVLAAGILISARQSQGDPDWDPLCGSATCIPLGDGTVDVALIRAMLMFLEPDQRAQAVAELFRVLRTGGRFSLFEPITQYETLARWDFGSILKSRDAQNHAAVVARVEEERSLPDRAIMSFDERDLIQVFKDAGFQEVNAAFEYRHSAQVQMPSHAVERMIHTPPNALLRSYASISADVLGDNAARHIATVKEVLRRTFVCADRATIYMWGTA